MNEVSKGNRLLLGATALVLLAAVGAAMAEIWPGESPGRLSPALAERIPWKVGELEGKDVPLGPSEFVDATAKEKMEYDDVLNREYQTPRGTFGIYIGYWGRGKRSPSHVASHTPDRCWTLAGMECEEADHSFLVRYGDAISAVGQGRRFRAPQGHVLYTAFWHRVGDRFYDYGGRLHDDLPPADRVKRVVRDLFFWREDQFFVRVTATRPLSDFASDPVFQAVMKAVCEVSGLVAVAGQ